MLVLYGEDIVYTCAKYQKQSYTLMPHLDALQAQLPLKITKARFVHHAVFIVIFAATSARPVERHKDADAVQNIFARAFKLTDAPTAPFQIKFWR